jgi:hypothetical protein
MQKRQTISITLLYYPCSKQTQPMEYTIAIHNNFDYCLIIGSSS